MDFEPDAIIGRLTKRLYGVPILRNDIRGEVVEEIVANALAHDWRLCSGDWAAWDLENPNSGLRRQVKQSAASQSWDRDVAPPRGAKYTIAIKTGRYDGALWVAEASRHADIFVFGWHPVVDANADHRKPEQWLFFVLAESGLPAQASISLAALGRLCELVTVTDLKVAVSAAMRNILETRI